jgi:hypothetical protein
MPNLRHLRDQAKDLVHTGAVPTLADAQFQIARQYGFPSWPKLKRTLSRSNRPANSGKPSAGMISRA